MRQLWYVRRGQRVSGPFPFPALEQDFLLGRLRLEDELSEDRATWLRVAEQPQIAAIVAMQTALPGQSQERDWKLERLAAARRWANQRIGLDREVHDERSSDSQPREGNRRAPSTTTQRSSQSGRSAPSMQPGTAWRWVAAVLALGILLLVLIAYYIGTVVPVPVKLGLQHLSRFSL